MVKLPKIRRDDMGKSWLAQNGIMTPTVTDKASFYHSAHFIAFSIECRTGSDWSTINRKPDPKP
jgi:hypothetical protein